jgi:dihydroorotate dehydrogenase
MPYRWLRPLLYLLPAEAAHRLVAGVLRVLQALPGGCWLLGALFGLGRVALGRVAFGRVGGPRGLEVEALGLRFSTPIGLAAGFDKDAEMYPALLSMGFGCVEVGTVTGEGQPGNPKPRLFRLVKDRALVNRMGFNNGGAAVVARRLVRRGRRPGEVVGVNIGKTKLVNPDDAAKDYEKSARLLGPLADYLVVNVSSPNTPGLRDLQAVSALRPILTVVRQALDREAIGRRVPLLVKIAPDLGDEDIDAIADLSLELGLDGIVATNTTISRSGLETEPEELELCGSGGLSGRPLKARAVEVLRRLHARVGGRLVLVSVGGIESCDDVWQRLEAGARLVQVYSAFVYEGPGLPGRLARELSERLSREGLRSLEELSARAAGARGVSDRPATAGSDLRTPAL